MSLAKSAQRPENQSSPNLLTDFVGLMDEWGLQLEPGWGWEKHQSPKASECQSQGYDRTPLSIPPQVLGCSPYSAPDP